MFDYSFDSIANYNNYFPTNNAKIVVGNLKFVNLPKKKNGESPKKNLSHFNQ